MIVPLGTLAALPLFAKMVGRTVALEQIPPILLALVVGAAMLVLIFIVGVVRSPAAMHKATADERDRLKKRLGNGALCGQLYGKLEEVEVLVKRLWPLSSGHEMRAASVHPSIVVWTKEVEDLLKHTEWRDVFGSSDYIRNSKHDGHDYTNYLKKQAGRIEEVRRLIVHATSSEN